MHTITRILDDDDYCFVRFNVLMALGIAIIVDLLITIFVFVILLYTISYHIISYYIVLYYIIL